MLQRAPVARPAAGRLRGARLRRHAADAGDDDRDARRARAGGQGSRTTGGRRSSSSAASPRLREHLRWFDARPLFGKRVLVTRPREQAAELVELLEEHGAEAIEAPMIRIVPPDDYGPLDEACARGPAVRLDRLRQRQRRRRVHRRLLATPLRSARAQRREAVRRRAGDRRAAARGTGLKVDLDAGRVPRRSARPGARRRAATSRGLRVLLPRADIGREVVADELRKQGADVTEVVAYRTVVAEPEREGEPDIYRMLLERRIDVVTFTSPSAVRNFVECSAPSRRPTCCERRSSRRSVRSQPKPRRSTTSRRRSCRRTTRAGAGRRDRRAFQDVASGFSRTVRGRQ